MHCSDLGAMAAAAAAAEAAETGARAGGRSHPEAEMEMLAAAGGSEGTAVNLCVTNVYNSSSSEVSSLETTNTIADLKRLLQEAFPSRPAPHQQRLIFRGKQCEETQQLGHVLRGVRERETVVAKKTDDPGTYAAHGISCPLRSLQVPVLLLALAGGFTVRPSLRPTATWNS